MVWSKRFPLLFLFFLKVRGWWCPCSTVGVAKNVTFAGCVHVVMPIMAFFFPVGSITGKCGEREWFLQKPIARRPKCTIVLSIRAVQTSNYHPATRSIVHRRESAFHHYPTACFLMFTSLHGPPNHNSESRPFPIHGKSEIEMTIIEFLRVYVYPGTKGRQWRPGLSKVAKNFSSIETEHRRSGSQKHIQQYTSYEHVYIGRGIEFETS